MLDISACDGTRMCLTLGDEGCADTARWLRDQVDKRPRLKDLTILVKASLAWGIGFLLTSTLLLVLLRTAKPTARLHR